MAKPVEAIRPSESFEYYTGQVYWNNFDAVIAHINRLISGRPEQGWGSYVKARYGVSKRALFIQCGNGWVERDCYARGLVEHVIGTDIGESMLQDARTQAAQVGLSAEYIKADTNTFDFTQLNYDWVFNHAAFHHIAYLDAALRSMWRGMNGQGLLICYDYTGPHRNQYDWQAWSAMLRFNETLPKEYQAKVRYPHMPTMLATDPTEAIHSELILAHCRRYFDIIELRPLGGAIAYELLFGNRALLGDQHTPNGAATLARIIAADTDFTAGDPDRSYFNFWVAAPRPITALDPSQLEAWTREEVAREDAAKRAGMRYVPPSALELIYNDVADLRDRLAAAGLA